MESNFSLYCSDNSKKWIDSELFVFKKKKVKYIWKYWSDVEILEKDERNSNKHACQYFKKTKHVSRTYFFLYNFSCQMNKV